MQLTMKAVLCISLLLGTCAYLATAMAPTGAQVCCSEGYLTNLFAADGHCSSQNCMRAMTLGNHSALVQFLDGCLQSTTTGTIDDKYAPIEKAMACAVPYLKRSAYSQFIFSQQQPSRPDPSTTIQRLEEANVAAMVLGYGCLGHAKTSGCQSLSAVTRPQTAGTPALLGFRDESIDIGGSMVRLNMNDVIFQCVSQELHSFSSSEWNGGMSQCALGNSTTSGVAEFAAPAGSSCHECIPPSSQQDQLFCGKYFSTTATAKYGAHCHKALSVERITKSKAQQAFQTDEYRLTSSVVVTRLNSRGQQCLEYLQALTCEIALGVCSSRNTMASPCQNKCRASLTNYCGVSQTDANAACAELGATNTDGSSCPAVPAQAAPTPAATTAAAGSRGPAPEPITSVDLVKSSKKRNQYNITICLSETQAMTYNAGILQVGVQAVIRKACNNLGLGDCQLASYTNDTTNCALRVIAIVETIKTSGSPSQQNMLSQLSDSQLVPASNLEVSVLEVDAYEVSASTGSDGSSPASMAVASSTMIFATMVVARLFF